jgi:hypothetical protein
MEARGAFKLIVFIVVAATMISLAPAKAAEDPSTATAWVCSPHEGGRPVKWVINGNKRLSSM